MRYASGRLVKCPRAADFAWRCQNGKFLYWYHNHGGPNFRARIARNSHYSFEDRNPVWLLGGIEEDGADGRVIKWSEPEIILYTDDPIVRISYPDLLEDDEKYFITETNKDIARIHEIDRTLIEGLWDQFTIRAVAADGLILDEADPSASLPMPWIPDFAYLDQRFADYRSQRYRQGITIDLRLELDDLRIGRVLIDNRTEDGRGFWLQTIEGGRVELGLRDDFNDNPWASDHGLLEAGTRHHLGVVIDGGPNVITYVIDGSVNDGGDQRQFGWGRFSPHLENVKGGETLRVDPAVRHLRLYERALRNTEIIGNGRAGR